MIFLVLGRGKTGRVVADVASERGHTVQVIGEEENANASALTAPMLAQFDVVIDFTTPEAVIPNVRACLANGARVVVGTTGWYDKLSEIRAICERRNGALLYGASFSVGVQAMYRLAEALLPLVPGYEISINETHHVSKKDKPSGTALTLKQSLLLGDPSRVIEVMSHREGDAVGSHVISAKSGDDVIQIRHDSLSRRSFAVGAIRAAEWLAGKTGCYDFKEIYPQLR
ncbi:MAG TPA: dihydrodipicolinate reductase C-terminal domain-containing protein [Acidobacteriaceae bacterium]|jgi:4-hydroxy-tetrahydrodipicolinate reductase|nr:dihydrodipicolinate reductase C-terminal domain-containing protein [Acidobacteriaceae bacterium]